MVMTRNPDRFELLRPALLCVVGAMFWVAVIFAVGQRPEKQAISIPFTDIEITYRWAVNWE